jgi:hypothetical protein
MKSEIIKLILPVIFVLCASMAAARRRTPIMGWCSWNTYRVNISDTLIMKQTDALVSTGLKDAGYTYINIDDGVEGSPVRI